MPILKELHSVVASLERYSGTPTHSTVFGYSSGQLFSTRTDSMI